MIETIWDMQIINHKQSKIKHLCKGFRVFFKALSLFRIPIKRGQTYGLNCLCCLKFKSKDLVICMRKYKSTSINLVLYNVKEMKIYINWVFHVYNFLLTNPAKSDGFVHYVPPFYDFLWLHLNQQGWGWKIAPLNPLEII